MVWPLSEKLSHFDIRKFLYPSACAIYYLDTYVKIEVLSSRGKKVAKSKTTIRRNMTDPEFNESFIFQTSEVDLREVTILFTVISISKTRKKKEVIGWFTMGKEATGLEEIEHWEEMMEKKEEKSTHYHLLTFQ